jgi:hypothetical protein
MTAWEATRWKAAVPQPDRTNVIHRSRLFGSDRNAPPEAEITPESRLVADVQMPGMSGLGLYDT